MGLIYPFHKFSSFQNCLKSLLSYLLNSACKLEVFEAAHTSFYWTSHNCLRAVPQIVCLPLNSCLQPLHRHHSNSRAFSALTNEQTFCCALKNSSYTQARYVYQDVPKPRGGRQIFRRPRLRAQAEQQPKGHVRNKAAIWCWRLAGSKAASAS